MTNEQRSFIESSDIVGFELECPKCHTQICYKMDETINLSSACPNCRTEFYSRPSNEEARLDAYVKALKGGRILDGLNVKVRLRLATPKEDK
jgi:hypothetical protein